MFSREFELETHHKPLEHIYGGKQKLAARIERWVLRLQGYQYNVVYRPGKGNIADCLSRLNQKSPKDLAGEKEDFVHLIAQEHTPVALSPQEIEVESEKDPELKTVRQYGQSGDWSECKMPHFLCVKHELCCVGKLILRGSRIIIPKSLRPEVLALAHEGHQGNVKTKNRLRSKVWWPKMDSDAEKLCRLCHPCQMVAGYQSPEPMQRVEPPSGPWQDLAVDFLGPFPGGESILVVVDYYSRFFEVVVKKSTKSHDVIRALNPIFARYGYPFSLKSDNGP